MGLNIPVKTMLLETFVENIDQFNQFGNVEQHWHHIISLETETWF